MAFPDLHHLPGALDLEEGYENLFGDGLRLTAENEVLGRGLGCVARNPIFGVLGDLGSMFTGLFCGQKRLTVFSGFRVNAENGV